MKSGLLLCVLLVPAAAASDVAQLEGISVSHRGGWFASPAAPSVMYLDGDTLRAQLATGRSLADVLAELVPGMAPASGTFTNSSQAVRGRALQLLIDGVPQGTNRNVSRDLFAVDPDAIERIEVIRGASTMFGGGAAGGLLNVVTKDPLPGAVRFDTRLGARTSLTEISGDGLGLDVHQGATGGGEIWSWRVDATWRDLAAEHDADGNRIAPEPSQGDLFDATSLALSAKVMAEWGDQRFVVFVSDLDTEQDTEFAADPAVNAFPDGTVPARAIRGLELDEQNQLDNRMINLAYTHSALGTTQLDAQVYRREFGTRFYPFDGRAIATWNAIAQSYIDSETTGARLTLGTPWQFDAFDVTWTYGLDFEDEETAMPVTVYDGAAYDASGGRVFVPVGDRTFMPATSHESLGGFVQAAVRIDDWSFTTGVRHERVDVSYPSFVTLGQGNAIAAGDIEYRETFGNASLSYAFTPAWRWFAGYAEGFELPDIGLQLRYAPAGFNTADARLAPVVTENIETGLRYRADDVSASIAIFESRSELGGVIIEDFTLGQRRTPERIYGVEAALDINISDAWRTGGTFTWLEGEQEDPAGDIALNGYRIPPEKLTAYVEWQQTENLDWRVQVLHSGNRDRAAEDGVGFGGREIESYSTVDLLASWRTASGQWRFGIENLFNADYYSVFSQLLRDGNNTSHLPAIGRTLTVQYTHDW